MLEKILWNLVLEGMSALTVWEYFITFFEKRNVKGIVIYIWLLFFSWQMMATFLFIDCPAWGKTIVGVVLVAVCSIFVYGDILGKIVFSILYAAIWMLGELLTGSLLLILKIPIDVYNTLGVIASKIMLFIFVKAVQLFFTNNTIQELSWKMNVKLMLLPIGSMYIGYHIFITEYNAGHDRFNGTVFFSVFLICILNVIVFNLYLRLSENLELKRKTSLYEKELRLLDSSMKEKQEFILEFRKQKHDLKHHMIEILGLAENENYTLMKTKILELTDLCSFEGMAIVDTGNSMLDTFINYKYAYAKKQGIDFRVHLDIPINLPFPNRDLYVILGNALDNAIEANLRGKIEKLYIDFKMIYEMDSLTIVIENAFDGKVNGGKMGKWNTRKKDVKNHGLGIGSIKNILKKYDGFYEAKIEEKIYRLCLILYQREERG